MKEERVNASIEGEKKYREDKRLIRNAMMEKQLVLFVGAGASVDAGMPLWGEAVKKIKDKLNLEDVNNEIGNLIIPQYYYNARGRKEYTQLIRETFHYYDKLNSGKIHNAIIQFGAETIVTTNYDHLIEQAAEKNGEFFYVVSQDADLPYKKAGKELIKMHGDFEHDNFVLKEDDYLHYHKNFKLIENYVKSLIGTKTVLFIGYSFGDPDIKHIVSWVKEILDEHFQRAYLIITGKKHNQNIVDYFKHLGVNIIYATELFDERDIKPSNESEQLLQTLYYLLDDEEKMFGIIDSLFGFLKPFFALHYTYRKYIEKALYRLRRKVNEEITLNIETDNYISYIGDRALDEEQEFLTELNSAIDENSQDYKVQIIAEILRRSVVKGTKREVSDGAKTTYETKEFSHKEKALEWIEAIYYFNYKKLIQIKENNAKILSENRPELFLQQAYICAFLRDYISAYYCLENAAISFYREREYSWYFISLWNKKNVAKIIIEDVFYNCGISQDVRESIMIDYDAIDLDKTLQTIPNLGNDNNQFLRDLKDFKFASDLFYDVVSSSMKSKEQASEAYFMFVGVPAYEQLRQQVYDYSKYSIRNYLMVDRYRENNEIYNLFARSIFASTAAPDKELSEESVFGYSGNIHAESLNAKDIHLILRYIEVSKLRKLFTEFNINIIEVDESGKDYLKGLIENVSPAFDLDVCQGKDIFWRLLCFVSHTKIDEKMVIAVLESLSILKQSEFARSKREALVEFINAIYVQRLFEDRKTCEAAKTLVVCLIDVVSKSKDCLYLYYTSICSLIYFCKEGECMFDDEDAIRKILSEDCYLLLADIYKGCEDSVKDIIKTIFDSWSCPDSGRGYRIYSKMVLAGIGKPNVAVEKRAFNYLIKHNKEKRKELEQGIKTVSEDDLEGYFINLYLSGFIIDEERLKKLIMEGNDEFSKWLMDIEKYEYTSFDLSWLGKCSPALLEKIAKNARARREVVSVYKANYSVEYIDNKTNEIVIKYFV